MGAVVQPGAAPRRAGQSAQAAIHAWRRSPVVRIVGRRLLLTVPLLFVVSALSFVLVSLTPGDAAQQILGDDATPANVATLRHQMGLDQPVYVQYWRWAKHAVRGDLGVSLFNNESVTHAISDRLPVTLSLLGASLLAIILFGVSLGVFSAVRGGAVGRFVDAIALIGFALPSYWVGAVLIAVFAVDVRWFPATGYVPITQSLGQWAKALVLPVAALALHGIAVVAKQTREAMLEVLGAEYIRAARANGIRERSLVYRHALKNASIRVITVLGVQVVGLLGGTILIENVFALPGLGGLAVSSSIAHDLPVVQGIVVCFTLIVVCVNLFIDLMYTRLDPRLRLQ